MRPSPLLALLLLLLPLPALAQDPLPAPLQAAIDGATADCKGFDNGTLTVGPDAISRPDLNGDGTPDWALDDSALDCSSDASYFCGSGGCVTTFLVGDTRTEIFGHGWQLVETEAGPVLLSFAGGVDCGLADSEPCVRAMVWSGKGWNTQPQPAATP
jgi:hypothetical protein